ncbi:hypothetical protein ACO2Q2_17445 [Dyella sp. KRB-257]|uniref:hypothetical protein n=1 Tax=Dyella sp. KRB-257 TaxID=3400915 RepID=UPI003C08551F
MSNHKTAAVMPMVKRLIKSDLLPLIEQVLCKRAEQYLAEIESSPVSTNSESILEPTYYVGHPDGTYSVAYPQPRVRHD